MFSISKPFSFSGETNEEKKIQLFRAQEEIMGLVWSFPSRGWVGKGFPRTDSSQCVFCVQQHCQEFTHLSPNCHFLCKTEMTNPSHLLLLYFFFLNSKVLTLLWKEIADFLCTLGFSCRLQSSRCKQSGFPLSHHGVRQCNALLKSNLNFLLSDATWPNYVCSPGAELGWARHMLLPLSHLSK